MLILKGVMDLRGGIVNFLLLDTRHPVLGLLSDISHKLIGIVVNDSYRLIISMGIVGNRPEGGYSKCERCESRYTESGPR